MLALVGRDRSGPDLWRCFFPISALDAAGYPAGWTYKDAPDVGLLAMAVDGFILPRISWPAEHRRVAEAWFESVRRKGQFVVFDADDDVFTSQETHRRVDLNWTEGKSIEQLEDERHQRIWALQQCDGVTVTTQRLATIARQYTDRPVIVVPNAIDLMWFRKIVNSTRRTIGGLTIGWAGGKRHDRDVEQMAEAWGRIARRYPDVTFVVQGHHPDVIREHVPAERLVELPWMPADKYPSGIRQVDIGCCAVADTPFNRAKSNIKAMEYAAAGAAVVASPTLYSSIVEQGHSGYICESVDEWEAALAELVEKPALRSMMQRRLLKKVERQHSLSGNLWRWVSAWATIQESAIVRRLVVA
jgi:glycosyltransferase involved in cell wall biosynthesis